MFEGIEILPERRVLLCKLFFGNGQFRAVDEIRERIFVQDTDRIERSAVALEIDPVLAGTQTKGGFAIPLEGSQRLFRMVELVLSQVAERIDDGKLLHGWKLFQLSESLIAKSYLKHG